MGIADPMQVDLPHARVILARRAHKSVKTLSLAGVQCVKALHEAGVRAVVVGFSGGADSTALLLTVLSAAVPCDITVHAVTVDHGVRSESAREAEQCAHIATQLGARSHVIRVEVGTGLGPEGEARKARRQALIGVAQGAVGDVGTEVPILLGHTADDQAETVLLRLARGSGSSSLRAISRDEVYGEQRWIRPLLHVRKTDLEEALRHCGVPWIEDPTNAVDGQWRATDGSPLRRSALRAHVIPALISALKIDVTAALNRTATLAADDDDALNQWAGRLYEEALVGRDLQLTPLKNQPAAVVRRVLKRYLLEAGAKAGDLAHSHLQQAYELIVAWNGQDEIHLPGVRVARIGKKSEACLRIVAGTESDPRSAKDGQNVAR